MKHKNNEFDFSKVDPNFLERSIEFFESDSFKKFTDTLYLFSYRGYLIRIEKIDCFWFGQKCYQNQERTLEQTLYPWEDMSRKKEIILSDLMAEIDQAKSIFGVACKRDPKDLLNYFVESDGPIPIVYRGITINFEHFEE